MQAPAPGLAPLPERLRFGRFELRPLERRLLADGLPVALGGRAFDLLQALLQRPDRVVPRHELIDAVWPRLAVEENNLSVQVNALRKALGDDAVVTVPGRGYRLAARFVDATPAAPAAPATTAAPLAATMAARTHLPSAQPLLIGRSDDLAALGTLIEQHRLVTVVGAGGMGKTRLAQALMQMRATGYRQGVCWVELATVSAPEALPGAVAVALGVQPEAGEPLASLARAVEGLQLLLALDNAEHLVDGVAPLAQALLLAAPGLRLLVTSQVPLRLALERVFRLGPLAIPQDTLPATQAKAFAAVAVFAERATAADSRFQLTDAQVPAVIALCRQLDGVALAIELAAARAPALGVDRLLASMSDRLRLLSSNRDRFAPQRQQTLRAAVAWSHDLLGVAEQRLFRRLAVLHGGATLEMVQAVAGDAPGDAPHEAPAEGTLDAWTLLDALDQLVQRSLVELCVDEDGGSARYRLLESPRAFALEQLAASGEDAAVRDRHARAVRDSWDAAEQAMQAGAFGVDAWRRDLGIELDGARDALQWARQRGDAALALGLARALVARLPPSLRDERLRLASLCQGLIEQVPDADLQQRAWAAIAVTGTDWPAATRSLALARQLDAASGGAAQGDRYRLYAALCEAARVVPNDPQALQAQQWLDEARQIEDPRWPPVRLRAAARIAATLAARRGDAAAALVLYRRLLQLSQAAGDAGLLTQVNIADIELQTGDAQGALRSCRALEAQLARGRDEIRLALARLCRAAAHLVLDEHEAARLALQQAWSVLMPAGRAVYCADYMALLAALEARHDDAAQLAGAADALYASTGMFRHVNETRARARCGERVAAALGAERAAALAAQGATLPPAALVVLAFPEPREPHEPQERHERD